MAIIHHQCKLTEPGGSGRPEVFASKLCCVVGFVPTAWRPSFHSHGQANRHATFSFGSGSRTFGGFWRRPGHPNRGPREIQAILLAFNRMQDRLRRFNEDRTRMIGAISHDLRTPLTRLRIRLEDVEDPREKHKCWRCDLHGRDARYSHLVHPARHGREPRLLINVSGLIEGVCDDAVDAGQPVTFSGPQEIEITCRPSRCAVRWQLGGKCCPVWRQRRRAGLMEFRVGCRSPSTTKDLASLRASGKRYSNPFYRRDPSRNPDTGGVGLGLSIARSVILEHGGNIHLANRKDGGLHVRLDYPVQTHAPKRKQRSHRSVRRVSPLEPTPYFEDEGPLLAPVDDFETKCVEQASANLGSAGFPGQQIRNVGSGKAMLASPCGTASGLATSRRSISITSSSFMTGARSRSMMLCHRRAERFVTDYDIWPL